jgi:hypothetical protein
MAVVVQLADSSIKSYYNDVRTIGGIYRGTVVEQEMTVFRMPKDVDELIGITEENMVEEEEESKDGFSKSDLDETLMRRVINMLF